MEVEVQHHDDDDSNCNTNSIDICQGHNNIKDNDKDKDSQGQGSSTSSSSTLKRCNSAPSIALQQEIQQHTLTGTDNHTNNNNNQDNTLTHPNNNNNTNNNTDQVQPMQCQPILSSSREISSFNIFSNNNQQRPRRFSASFSPHAVHSPNGHGPRLTPRVSQLRQEESVDFTNVRELAHERETHNAMQMSQSWEDLSLMCGGGGSGNSSGPASPTRIARLSPGVSPSPTRKAFATRRSLSPIAMRPSCLSPIGRPSGLTTMKRRFDLDEMPAAKRCCWSSDRLTPSTPGTPDSLSDSTAGFTFRPVSPRVSPSPSPMSAGQTHPPQNPS